MNAASVWLCGWALGFVALYKAAARNWRNPATGSWFTLLRQFLGHPLGIFAIAVASFMLWWIYVIDVPWRVWCDVRRQPDAVAADASDDLPTGTH